MVFFLPFLRWGANQRWSEFKFLKENVDLAIPMLLSSISNERLEKLSSWIIHSFKSHHCHHYFGGRNISVIKSAAQNIFGRAFIFHYLPQTFYVPRVCHFKRSQKFESNWNFSSKKLKIDPYIWDLFSLGSLLR